MTCSWISGDEFPEEIADRALGLGKHLVQAWKNKDFFPEIQAGMAAFKERMRQLMQYRGQEWPYEYEYWQKTWGGSNNKFRVFLRSFNRWRA